MTNFEYTSIIISCSAVIVSILSLTFTKINMRKVEKIYYGQSELIIRESITSAKDRITGILYNSAKNNNQYTRQCIKVAIEEFLNAYEEACAKYIDCKIDKKRFKKIYIDEIKNIVESDDLKKYFQYGSKYEAIKKVYDEWFNLEK